MTNYFRRSRRKYIVIMISIIMLVMMIGLFFVMSIPPLSMLLHGQDRDPIRSETSI